MPRGVDPEIRVEGGRELAALARQLKAEVPALRRKLPARLRKAVAPVVDEVKREAAQHSKMIPSTVKARTTMGGQVATVRLITDPGRLPVRHKALPGLMELGSQGSAGRYIRHPGIRGGYHNQPTHPYFYPVAERSAGKVQKVLEDVMDEVSREAGFR